MKRKTVDVIEFKANRSKLLDQIDREGVTLTITKSGRPMVIVGPPKTNRLTTDNSTVKLVKIVRLNVALQASLTMSS